MRHLDVRVAGGSPVNVGEAPSVVQILLKGVHQCGGFIYSNRWIVTTAECVYRFIHSINTIYKSI